MIDIQDQVNQLFPLSKKRKARKKIPTYDWQSKLTEGSYEAKQSRYVCYIKNEMTKKKDKFYLILAGIPTTKFNIDLAQKIISWTITDKISGSFRLSDVTGKLTRSVNFPYKELAMFKNMQDLTESESEEKTKNI